MTQISMWYDNNENTIDNIITYGIPVFILISSAIILYYITYIWAVNYG